MAEALVFGNGDRIGFDFTPMLSGPTFPGKFGAVARVAVKHAWTFG
jgi:hypothetical protein